MRQDPLRAARPLGDGGHASGNYWADTAGDPPDDDGPLDTDRSCDVAIIGAGYTGLSCAHHLAKSARADVVVLEANLPGFGCSGRNGSFARPAIGRLSQQAWIDRWGEARAREAFAESLEALETVRTLIREGGNDCDVREGGWMRLAHSPSRLGDLQGLHRLLERAFGYKTHLLDAETIAREHLRSTEAHAALHDPNCFVLHPMKYAYALARLARGSGAALYTRSPVIGWEKSGGRHRLSTPGGTVEADRVVVATNGYITPGLSARLSRGILPALSDIIVTRPLTDEEIEATNFRTHYGLSDTRRLLHYFRKLPDNRILFGGRGTLRGGDHTETAQRRMLLDALARKFPPLANVEAEYFWGGWIGVSRDSLPHTHEDPEDPSILQALGYSGTGVAAATYGGRRAGEHLSGERPLSGMMHSPLPAFPLPALRRTAQALGFLYYRWKDAR